MNDDLISRQALKEAQSIQPEQKTGRWIEHIDKRGDTYHECSSCKEEFTLIEGTPADNLYNYCPNCGAKMEVDENGQWISVKEQLPKDNQAVNITWVNRSPTRYYADIKDKPFTATAVYYHGRWYWWTAIIRNILEDCEKAAADWEIDDCIDVTAWMPLPEPYSTKENENES